jgi:hypothetical protein
MVELPSILLLQNLALDPTSKSLPLRPQCADQIGKKTPCHCLNRSDSSTVAYMAITTRRLTLKETDVPHQAKVKLLPA